MRRHAFSSAWELGRLLRLFRMPMARLSANTAITLTTRMTALPMDITARVGLTMACSLALAPGMDGVGAAATAGVVDGAIAAVTATVVAVMDTAVVDTATVDAGTMADVPDTVE